MREPPVASMAVGGDMRFARLLLGPFVYTSRDHEETLETATRFARQSGVRFMVYKVGRVWTCCPTGHAFDAVL